MARAATTRRPKLVHHRETVRMGGASLRIVAVADTHGKPHTDLDARLRELRPDHIVHAGDVGDLGVLRQLEAHAPVTAVRGNIDGHVLPDFVTLGVHAASGNGGALLDILLTHIAVYGTKLRADVARLAKAEGAVLVVCGHSHIPFAARDGAITIFNPGSVGPRRFQLPIVLGVIDVTAAGVGVRHVDCETGAAWTPPRRALAR